MSQIISIRQGALAHAISLMLGETSSSLSTPKAPIFPDAFSIEGREFLVATPAEILLELTLQSGQKYNHFNLLRSYCAQEDLSTKEDSKEA